MSAEQEVKEETPVPTQGPKRYKLSRKRIPIIIEGIDGVESEYEIMEMMGDAKSEWMNFFSSRLDIRNGTPTGLLKDFKGVEEKLISMCLYDGQGKSVSVQTITQWPGTLKKDLYEECQKINGLDKESHEQEKNG